MEKKRFYILTSMLSLAAILVIAAIILVINGAVNSKNNIKNAENSATSQQEKKKTVESALFSFYNWYIRQNSDVFTDGSYKDRGTLTDDLIEKIEKNVQEQKDSENKIDPVICGQGMPDTVTVVNVDFDGNKANVGMNLNYIKSRMIKLSLVLQDNQWRITDIICQ